MADLFYPQAHSPAVSPLPLTLIIIKNLSIYALFTSNHFIYQQNWSNANKNQQNIWFLEIGKSARLKVPLIDTDMQNACAENVFRIFKVIMRKCIWPSKRHPLIFNILLHLTAWLIPRHLYLLFLVKEHALWLRLSMPTRMPNYVSDSHWIFFLALITMLWIAS